MNAVGLDRNLGSAGSGCRALLTAVAAMLFRVDGACRAVTLRRVGLVPDRLGVVHRSTLVQHGLLCSPIHQAGGWG